MATLKAALQLYDGMTGPLKNIMRTMNTVNESFASMQAASANAVDVGAIQSARAELAQAGAAITQIEENIRRSQTEQERFNQKIRNGSVEADSLGSKIKGFVGAFVGMTAVNKAKNWIAESLDFTDAQQNVERQLQTVLRNVGAAEGAFASLKETASGLQGATLYGDEALLGGAAELATYISDDKAIEHMMGTLTNYAAGMSGGGEVAAQQMVEYATQLGKALDGTFDGLNKKGFTLTDAQKKVIKFGSDMEKALVIDEVISQSWAGLAEQMAGLPRGKIIQLKNSTGDIREEVGAKLYPHVIRLLDIIQANMPGITAAIHGVGDALGGVINFVASLLEKAMLVYDFIYNNWSTLEPIIVGLAGATLGYAVALGVQTVATNIANGAAKAFFNTLLANPLFWVALAIGAVVARIYEWVQAVGGVQIAWLILKDRLLSIWEDMQVKFYMVVFLITLYNSKMALAFATASASIKNTIGDMKVKVLTTLQAMVNGAIGLINDFIGAINRVAGTSIEAVQLVTFGTTAALENNAAKDARNNELQQLREELEQNVKEHAAGLVNIDLERQNATAMRQAEIATLQNEARNRQAADPWAFDDTLGGIAADLADTAGNTGSIKDSLDAATEDLKYLRDLAEQEVVNRFTTAEIKVDMTNHNTISDGMDKDAFVAGLADQLEEALFVVAEGVH